MQQNNIEEIRKQILNKYKLRIGDSIKYDLLHIIYQMYDELFDEKTFAQEVLQISYGSYCRIKYDSNKRAILLKDEKVDINLIREEILQRFSLKPGDKITYQKLCEIARQYEQIIDERTIAYEVLGISKCMLYPIKKNPNHSTTILAKRSEQHLDNLRKNILKGERITPGDYINFEQLHIIAEKYKIDDKDLATKIFGIKGFNYRNIKYQPKRRTKILFGLTEEREEKYDIELEELRNKIIKGENLIPGSKIDYEQFSRIYRNYSSLMKEVDFAVKILGLKKTRFFNLKSNRKDKAVILKDMLDVVIEQTRKQLIEGEIIKPGDTIDYERLTMLIEKWKKTIDEDIFVRNVLGLSSETVNRIRNNPNQKSIVMKKFIEENPEEEIIAIRNKIFESEDVKPGSIINYEKFLILYAKYKNGIDEKTFAIRVLLIPQDKYLLIKRKSTKKTTICKELVEEIGHNEIDYIRRVVYDEYGITEGDKINYEKLIEIAERWRDIIQEKSFAYKVLGISEKSYYAIKHDSKKQAYVLNPKIKEKADKIRYIIRREKRFYSLEEIKRICEESGLTIDEFCSYVVQREMHKRVYLNRNIYSELLRKKEKIFIGRGERISREFAIRNQNLIIGFARSLAIELCVMYQAKHYIEDYAQDTMVYIIENCGDLEKNFEDDFDLCKGLIYTRAKAFIRGRILIGKKAKTISVDSYYKDRKDKSLIIKDQDVNVEKEAINNLEKEEDRAYLIKKVLNYIESGLTPLEAIKKITEKYGLEFEDLIEEFREYYKKNDKKGDEIGID